jgi:hypothetical protein
MKGREGGAKTEGVAEACRGVQKKKKREKGEKKNV